MENPPKSPFQKGDLKESGLFYNSLRARFGRLGWGMKPNFALDFYSCQIKSKIKIKIKTKEGRREAYAG